MKEFIEHYKDRIHGVLSCFDRMLFRGYLPIMSGWQMAQFFNSSGNPISRTEDVSSRKRRTCEAACPVHRRTRRKGRRFKTRGGRTGYRVQRLPSGLTMSHARRYVDIRALRTNLSEAWGARPQRQSVSDIRSHGAHGRTSVMFMGGFDSGSAVKSMTQKSPPISSQKAVPLSR